METRKVMLVDDQLLFLEGLKIVLENHSEELSVIYTAKNGREAVELLEQAETLPDIILMDVRMPHMDGVAATRHIKERYPDIHIIMLTTFEDDNMVIDALHCGAAGYLLKNIPPEMLISAIQAVCDGAVLMAPDIAGKLIQNIYRDPKQLNRDLHGELPDWYRQLTAREKAIIRLLIQGKTNKDIADEIHVGFQTIRNYISTIYSKMGALNRMEAIKMAETFGSFLFD